jgi:hypothetical protein
MDRINNSPEITSGLKWYSGRSLEETHLSHG